MENELFNIATKISTPLILAGIIMIGLFLVISKLFDSQAKDKDISANKLKLAKMVFRSIFVLAVLCLIVGAAGWFYEKNKPVAVPVPVNTIAEVSFYLYLNSKSVGDVRVKANNLQTTRISDQYGKVSFSFDSTKVDSLFLEFNSEPLRILNAMNVAVNNLPNRFDLVQQPPSSPTNPTSPPKIKINIAKYNLKNIPKMQLQK